jgi:hypothetical protein
MAGNQQAGTPDSRLLQWRQFIKLIVDLTRRL